MIENTSPRKIELTPLPYQKNALEPYISESTLHFHHDKHHATYVNKLNELIDGTPFATMSLCDIIRHSEGAVFNNAAQVWNHTFYFSQFAPTPKKSPSGALMAAIQRDFESVETLIKELNNRAATLFGSGWVWLSSDKNGKLFIEQRSNAGNPLTDMLSPLIAIDVWEHAYYIDYKNARADAIAAIWNILDWSIIEERYNKIINCSCHSTHPLTSSCR